MSFRTKFNLPHDIVSHIPHCHLVHRMLVAMWFMTGKVEDEPLRTLDNAAKTKSGFSADFLLPDTRDVLEERETLSQAHQDGSNIQLIEEDIRKHDKALTDVLVASVIFHHTSIEIACTNLGCLMKTTTTFIDTLIAGNDAPFLQVAAQRLVLLTSLAVFC